MKKINDLINSFTLPNGLEIDIDEGWKKLISRQFGGEPGRGFNELIQNLIDSYPGDVQFEERKGKIITTEKTISIIDYGEGLDSERIKLLLTLGGTDKVETSGKIGKFGIGFYSIFNPRLETKNVIVTTKCENQVVRIEFIVNEPEKKPAISAEILDSVIYYSTKIEIVFNNSQSVISCLYYARKYLWYYPCKVTINNENLTSIWETARNSEELVFQTENCHGIIHHKNSFNYQNGITILCKYEYIFSLSFECFFSGGYNLKYDLSDFRRKNIPYINNLKMTVNSNALSVTISRDGYYLNSAFYNMVNDIKTVLIEKLHEEICSTNDKQIILANQYVFHREISDYLQAKEFKNLKLMQLAQKLAESKVYKINGKPDEYSIQDIYQMKSTDVPLYYSENKNNLRWLGGAFKHDFIVVPDKCTTNYGAPDFYETLFDTVFQDVVNLDTIWNNPQKIKELVERSIVNQEALSPQCEIIEGMSLSDKEKAFVHEMEKFLGEEAIKYIFSGTVKIPVDNIKTAFFKMKDEKCQVTTGLFTNYGKPLNHQIISNFLEFENQAQNDTASINKPKKNTSIVLGLRIDNPLIQLLVNSNDKNRMYFALTYISSELSNCQKKLVPYSDFSDWERKKMTSEMRAVFIKDILRKTTQS